jgi:hypothetical protein
MKNLIILILCVVCVGWLHFVSEDQPQTDKLDDQSEKVINKAFNEAISEYVSCTEYFFADEANQNNICDNKYQDNICDEKFSNQMDKIIDEFRPTDKEIDAINEFRNMRPVRNTSNDSPCVNKNPINQGSRTSANAEKSDLD